MLKTYIVKPSMEVDLGDESYDKFSHDCWIEDNVKIRAYKRRNT